MKLFGFLELTLVDVFDILLVSTIIFIIYKRIKNTPAMKMFIAILIILLVRLLAGVMNMKLMSQLLGAVVDLGAVALLVIFQPEIRRFLSRIGKNAGTQSFIGKFFKRTPSEINTEAINEITKACEEMSEEKVGALIVFPGKDTLDGIVETGDIVDAQISQRLIENIFFKNSPLHDGAMIIRHGRILAARCTLPITTSTIPARYGMRHKSAVGLTEECDARVVVVSEQTGHISFVKEGQIKKVDNINSLKLLLAE